MSGTRNALLSNRDSEGRGRAGWGKFSPRCGSGSVTLHGVADPVTEGLVRELRAEIDVGFGFILFL